MLEGVSVPHQESNKGRSISWKVKLLGRGLVLLFTLSMLEIVSCVGGRVLRERGTFYQPHSSEGFAAYLAARDPETGWPPPGQRPDRDPSGSRISVAFPDHTQKSCVSIYGDSFAWGDEVDHEHAWGDVLARLMSCRVNNQGVTGYGTDQALVRFRRRTEDRSKIALLGFPNENIQRNVNQFRGLLVPKGSAFGFKPRFKVGAEGKLELLPIIAPDTVEEHAAMMQAPERYFKDDYFVPGGPGGVSTLSFPYTLSIASLAKHYRIRSAMKRESSYVAFFHPEHASGALQVTAGIAKAFHDEAKERGSWGAFVFIPLIGDMEARKKKGTLVHQPLIDELTRMGVPYLDPTDMFLKHLDGKDPCTLFTKCLAGHYNVEGYKLFAESVHALLKEKGQI